MSMSSPDARGYNEQAGEILDLGTEIRRKVISRDPRFQLAAYIFVYEALTYTQKMLGRDDPSLVSTKRHVSGQELLEGIRQYAEQEFGPLAPTVFRTWGVQSTEDFGRLVFNLVESNLLGKTEQDNLKDFAGGFDFNTAFDGPRDVTLQ